MADTDSTYASVTQVKTALGISVATYDTDLADLVVDASRVVDQYCNRRFYTPTSDETRKYDLPRTPMLWLDEDLYSLTTLKNGDGSTIASTEYVLEPANTTPKFGIRLLVSRGNAWLTNAGQIHQVIEVIGQWGYSESAPEPIRRATILACGFALNLIGEEGGRIVRKSVGGSIDMQFQPLDAAGLPLFVREILDEYKMPAMVRAWTMR